MSACVARLATRIAARRVRAPGDGSRSFISSRLARVAPSRLGAAPPPGAVLDSRGAAADSDAPLTPEEETLRDVTRKLVDCRRRKAAANAVDLLVGLGREGIDPDLFAATTCLGACVAAGKQDLALKVFEEVFEKDVVKPDEVVFAELIRGHLAAQPPAWPRVNALLARMDSQYGVAPTAMTYNILLGKCADDNELERAEDLIDRMADDDVAPDQFTFESVKKRRSIRSYAKKVLLV